MYSSYQSSVEGCQGCFYSLHIFFLLCFYPFFYLIFLHLFPTFLPLILFHFISIFRSGSSSIIHFCDTLLSYVCIVSHFTNYFQVTLVWMFYWALYCNCPYCSVRCEWRNGIRIWGRYWIIGNLLVAFNILSSQDPDYESGLHIKPGGGASPSPKSPLPLVYAPAHYPILYIVSDLKRILQ